MKTATHVRTTVATLAFAAACTVDAYSPEPEIAHLRRLALSHLTRIVLVDDQITIEVYAFDEHSKQLKTPPLEWSSDDPQIASVDVNGRVTGNSIGSVTVRARAGDIEGSIRIDVRAAALEILTQQGPPTLLVGESAVYRAEFRSSSGKTIPTPENVTWATGDPDLLKLSSVPGLDASYVRVTALATGLASLSVGVDWKESLEIIGVLPERVPDDVPLRVSGFYFFTSWDDHFGYMPTMAVTVMPGRSVELMRVEVAVAGLAPKQLPSLCSNRSLAAGEHNLLGLTSYPGGTLTGYSYVSVSSSGGAALLTYRADDGKVITMAVRGSFDVWGYGSGYPTQFRWSLCDSSR